ncbi:Inner membrane protein alx [Actinomyces bovis]|uniref:Inner membrane protein alx n=1 Tax=Actinomyces bovis TaxID=1658 RepID=A0ABY1VJU6_9ACTO|nr:TerC/Alx family metal homeostasis membrane protein [Actinomyces bovis]SPT52381.1 Inner membrane protein alx [Actinomyces bovis]VEG53971.1 Inner membrane protein alx [Actinomyces israelii]
MTVTPLAWGILILLVVILLTVDFMGHARNPHPPTMREATTWTLGYATLAVLYGAAIWYFSGSLYAQEFYAGWITEWSLSVDNLFVFILILRAFRVPRDFQQKALLLGIIIALVFRFAFILMGAALIEHFSWVFYIFGAFLIYTAIKQVMDAGPEEHDDEEEAANFVDNGVTRLVRRIWPTTDGFVGNRLIHRHGGRTLITPLLIVVIALGSADLMFAFDSIPAIFGLTQEPFLVFSATAFSLLGLRQLFFLIDGLLERLVFLPYGLGVILGFIGLKLINHALHENELPFINGGQPVLAIPEPSTAVSLGVIVVTLVIVTVASLVRTRKLV